MSRAMHDVPGNFTSANRFGCIAAAGTCLVFWCGPQHASEPLRAAQQRRMMFQGQSGLWKFDASTEEADAWCSAVLRHSREAGGTRWKPVRGYPAVPRRVAAMDAVRRPTLKAESVKPSLASILPRPPIRRDGKGNAAQLSHGEPDATAGAERYTAEYDRDCHEMRRVRDRDFHPLSTALGTGSDDRRARGFHPLSTVLGTGSVGRPCGRSYCVWTCAHHRHLQAEADFEVDASTVHEAADAGCPACGLFNRIMASRCACGGGSKASREGIHVCSRLVARFARIKGSMLESTAKLAALEVYSTCGQAVVEAVVLESPTPPRLPLPLYGDLGSVHGDKLSPQSVAWVKERMDGCDQWHLKCKSNGRDLNAQPTLLLDIGGNTSVPSVRLMRNGGEKSDYIALSYCWGGMRPPITTKGTLKARMRGIAWDELPRTFQDVIFLCRALDVNRLWIDALCIVQDDPIARNEELARMREIFQCANLVVIAAEGRTPNDGVLKPLDEADTHRWNWDEAVVKFREVDQRRWYWDETVARYRELEQEVVRFRNRLHACPREAGEDACRDGDDSLEQPPITKRAWTYQERLLARRCLIFRRKEMVWECRMECKCECGGENGFKPQLLPWAQFSAESTNQHFWFDEYAVDFWKSAVQDFSLRKLTVATDRLPAISALARVVAMKGRYYLGGLIGSRGVHVVNDLKWKCIPQFESRSYARTQAYIAPSWSWVACPFPVSYRLVRDVPREDALAEHLESGCILAGPNEFGEVTDGYLMLSGIHCEARAAVGRSRQTGNAEVRLILDNRALYTLSSDCPSFAFLDHAVVESRVTPLSNGGKQGYTLQRVQVDAEGSQDNCVGLVRLLWLHETCCMLLAHSMRVEGSFERLGLLDGEMCPPVPDIPAAPIRLV